MVKYNQRPAMFSIRLVCYWDTISIYWYLLVATRLCLEVFHVYFCFPSELKSANARASVSGSVHLQIAPKKLNQQHTTNSKLTWRRHDRSR